MSAFLAVIPIIVIRYTLLGRLSNDALKRAAFFAPLLDGEWIAYWVYQAATVFIVADSIFLKIRVDTGWFYAGAGLYGLGLLLYAKSIVDYARPDANGMNGSGLYRLSRNPMYVAYFICILGCALLAASWGIFAALIVFQAASHWIILSEERWCIAMFGDEYLDYMKRVRRYI